MRTVPWNNVWEAFVRLHGRDPRVNTNSDIARSFVDHANARVRIIWEAWPWPEWIINEERAFRPLWDSTEQYGIFGSEGLPDEVFYLGDNYTAGDDEFGTNFGYYKVLVDAVTDPPVGTKPTNTDFWEELSPVDTFIEYDQRDRRPIGEVVGVYSRNTRVPTGSMYGGQSFTPSEKGLDVRCVGNPTVFMTYKMVCPQYTMIPFVPGRTYFRGEVVFSPDDSNCYQAIRETTDAPDGDTSTDDWIFVPFLKVWEKYVVHGAFADSLMEFDQGGNGEIQSKMVLNQYWNQKADDALQAEVDALVTQGQKLRYRFCGKVGNCCQSQPWAGGLVSLLGQ